MQSIHRTLLLICLIAASPVNAKNALDEYNGLRKEAEHSSLAQLKLKLILDDCKSLLGIADSQEFEAMVESVKANNDDFFDEWEVDVRRQYDKCGTLITSFKSEEGYSAQRRRWLQKSVKGGSVLAKLIALDEESKRYTFNRQLRSKGLTEEVVEKPCMDNFEELLCGALSEAYEHGDQRLKQAAIFQVHRKFRYDESAAIGASDYEVISAEHEHALRALRSETDELPWEYLSCKYSQACTIKMFADHLLEGYGITEIDDVVAIADYYERCITAKDWVALGLHE
ncbi:hypothetical protein [Congregibacter litoralis]|uniref:Lysozyme inhibitor LprI N-terminal domain-containing protein n=1 Tax=Congregibacter litoralis KT71 TaxID=314285 RepID=A4A4Q6_9GAMM|nr:hypothetical protein [Congregibacter litoralis]EAQ98777.2 hypothetical protein KT71_09127 [Congregibacter litoralis KT71]